VVTVQTGAGNGEVGCSGVSILGCCGTAGADSRVEITVRIRRSERRLVSSFLPVAFSLIATLRL
jgi:hypothetical protein